MKERAEMEREKGGTPQKNNQTATRKPQPDKPHIDTQIYIQICGQRRRQREIDRELYETETEREIGRQTDRHSERHTRQI